MHSVMCASAVTFPARFQLMAAMNPCPCGFKGHPTRECRCTPVQVAKYLSKISGPLLDRIDLHVWTDPVDVESVLEGSPEETSQSISAKVLEALSLQRNRGGFNSRIADQAIDTLCQLPRSGKSLLATAMRQYHLSMRGYKRVIKVARTIADLEGANAIGEQHLAEALQYRPEFDP